LLRRHQNRCITLSGAGAQSCGDRQINARRCSQGVSEDPRFRGSRRSHLALPDCAQPVQNHFSKERERLDECRDRNLDHSWIARRTHTSSLRRRAGCWRGRGRGLSVQTRHTLELRFYQGVHVAEIAAGMNCPVGTAKANYHHAIMLCASGCEGRTMKNTAWSGRNKTSWSSTSGRAR